MSMQICSKYESCALSLCSFIHWRWYYPNHLNYISAWNILWWPQTFHFSKSGRWYTAFIKLSQLFFCLEKLLFYLHFLKNPFAGYRMLESESHSVMSDSLRPHGLYSPWNSPGQKTGVGSRSLSQGIFPTQGSNPGLPHCRQILYQLSHRGNPNLPFE